MVRTFNPSSGGAQWCQGCYTMEESTDHRGEPDEQGDYVTFGDYQTLAAELTDASHELVTSVSALATALARVKALEAIIARDDTTESFKCSECGAWHVRKPTAPERDSKHD